MSTKAKQKVDYAAIDREILVRTDILAEATRWGIVFPSNIPTDKGWLECHAFDREDANPSAAICVESDNGSLGKYRDLAGERAITLFELGARTGAYATWRECRAALAEKVGVALPVKRKRRTLAENAGDQLEILTADPNDPLLILYATRLSAAKPGTTPQGIIDAGARFGKWCGELVLAFPGYSADGPPAVKATVLYRVGGEPFPAVDLKGGRTLRERKSHTISGSVDSIIVAGGWERLQRCSHILLVEGPPDLWAASPIVPDYVAVITTTHGSQSVPKDLGKIAAGKVIWNLSDRDRAGRLGADLRFNSVQHAAPEFRDCELPYSVEERHGKDLRDFISERGESAWSDLEALALATPPRQLTAADVRASVVISNFETVDDEETGESRKVPKSMGQIIDEIAEHTGGWPRRIDGMLFVDDDEHGISYFDRRTTAALFGWLRSRFDVDWGRGGAYVSQPELYAELERMALRYTSVEVLPHEPPIAGVYYRGNRPEIGDGSHLGWILDRFRPATAIDRDLIQAAFMTPLWGGAPGRRPAFAITSKDGRGVGKTSLPEFIGRLYGGVVDVASNEDIQDLKTRLLSPASRTFRIGLVDNIKTLRMSWAEFEAIITSPIISGRQLFVGEAQRPNLLTWFLTLNGISLATDLAQRVVIIELAKGENRGDWHETTAAYIDEHREQIIGDIIAALQAEKFPLSSYSRWATWEAEVLCRLAEPGEAQKVILERQREANCEQDEAEIIEQYFFDQLASYRYEPSTAQVRIPVAVAALWFSKAIGEPIKTAAASKRINQMSNEGQLKRLSADKCRTYGRAFVWTGIRADINRPIDNHLASLIADRLDRQN